MRVRVAVVPASEWTRRPRLFRALARAFPASFEGRSHDETRDVDAALLFDRRRIDRWRKVPALVIGGDAPPLARSPVTVTFSDALPLDARLRRRNLVEDAAPPFESLTVPDGSTVLASVDELPVWMTHANAPKRTDSVALAPRELGAGESLENHLSAGRFLSLLPLIHFLRNITGYAKTQQPPLRATFIFDDPNLHTARYGFIDYRRLKAHAREHRYHASMAMVPMDGWFGSDAAKRLFRGSRSQLSLVMHGNNHSRRELAHSPQDLLPILAQAMRRVESIERRFGIEVGRVMVPPHGFYSSDAPELLASLGYEALCAEFRPNADGADDLLGAWSAADLARGGLPLVRRYHLRQPRPAEALVLWAYLDQPLILYGHHGDVAEGMDVSGGRVRHRERHRRGAVDFAGRDHA